MSKYRRAFTLIELLVVIGIIGVLVAIGLFVGRAVMGSGKQRATEALVQVADKALEAYYDKKGEGPADRYTYKNKTGEIFEFAMLDGRDGANSAEFDRDKKPAFDSFARFALACKDVPEADAVLRSISDPRQSRNVVVAPGIVDDPTSGNKVDLRSVEFLDGFGRPLRFVHPAFHGGFGAYLDQAQKPAKLSNARLNKDVKERRGSTTITTEFRRSYRPFDPEAMAAGQDPKTAVGDADEGICPSARGYFYSSGLDQDAGTREDNVYSVKPSFAYETQAFN
ncbi:MAG: type II secretion system protein [Phycisphaerae bacterium]|nr:type II secretion system protein [Phycisphaerae bacterium]